VKKLTFGAAVPLPDSLAIRDAGIAAFHPAQNAPDQPGRCAIGGADHRLWMREFSSVRSV
jgi:hypothetical protein